MEETAGPFSFMLAIHYAPCYPLLMGTAIMKPTNHTTHSPRLSLLGAYEILTKSTLFPRPFWVSMEQGDLIVVEMEDPEGFTCQFVKREELEEALEAGKVRKERDII